MFTPTLRPFLLLLIAAFISFTVVIKHPVAAQVSQSLAINIADKGAIPGDTIDDAPAFRQALQELGGEEGSGGTILVPPGRWLISSEVTAPLLTGKSIRLVGMGSDSVIVVNTPGLKTFYLASAESVIFERLTFVAGNSTSADAEHVIRIDGAKFATIKDCNFYGVGTAGSNGRHSAIWFFNSFGILERVGFYGTASAQGSVVLFSSFRGVVVRDVTFLDYGTHNGTLYSKLPGLPTNSWLEVRDPVSSVQNAATNGSAVVIENFVGDEGAVFQIFINPAAGGTGRRIHSARLSNINSNVSGTIGLGVLASDVDTFDLKHSWFGYTSASTAAFRLHGIKKATLYGIKFGQGVDRYEIDSSNENVEIVASSASSRLCSAQTCRVSDGYAGAASQGGEVTGSGIKNKLAKWSSSSNLGPSSISDEDGVVKFTGNTVTFANPGGVIFEGTAAFSGKVNLGGSPILPAVSAESDLVLGASHAIVLANATAGTRTIYLPNPEANVGKTYTIKKIDSSPNAVKLDSSTFSKDKANIDGAPNYFMTTPYASITVISQGGHWWIISKLNSDSVVQVTSTALKVNEGAGFATISVTRVGDASKPAMVHFATTDEAGLQNCTLANVKASERCDYGTTVGTLQFAIGESVKTATIPIVNDALVEGDETFTVKLSDVIGARLGAANAATVTIVENDTSATAPNPLNDVPFFVTQQYIDFLGRLPDTVGLANWTTTLRNCPNDGFGENSDCGRVHVSSSFFLSEEFRGRGYFAYKFYEVGLDRRPTYAEFVPDMAEIGGSQSPEAEARSKAIYTNAFVQQQEFKNRYDALSNSAYVNALETNAEVTLTNKAELVNALNANQKTRAQVLREIVELQSVTDKFVVRATVAMQYFGYLRRDPDAIGYNNWVATLTADPSNFNHMIFGFVYSEEYRHRFGS